MEDTKILVVDDHVLAGRTIANMVKAHGHAVVTCLDVEGALRAFDAESFDVVLSDVKMGILGGFDLLRGIRKRAPHVPVVLVTGEASISDAMDAMDAGAYDYISKPVLHGPLGVLLHRAIEHKRLMLQDAASEPEPLISPDLPNIIGKSPIMLAAFMRVARAARGDANVLILGESGTGKEMVARALHKNSERADKPFVAVNMGAMASGVAESELFGHRRGAFTDARESRTGLFEQAQGGTLFLDEIGDLELGLQVKLLRAIQERRIKPVGGNEEIDIDIRLVSATNRNLLRRVREGVFREDLYYRINVVSISLPPLRERTEDIPQLAAYFLGRFGAKSGRRVPHLSSEALLALQRHPWPGNVRELENVMQRAVQFCTDGIVTLDQLMLGDEPASSYSEPNADEATMLASEAGSTDANGGFTSLDEHEAAYINDVLKFTDGNITRAAKILGVARRTIQRRVAGRRHTSE